MSQDELLDGQVTDWRYIFGFINRANLDRKTDDELRAMLNERENSFGYSLYNILGLSFLRNYSLRAEAIKYSINSRKLREEKDKKDDSKKTKKK